MYSFLKFGEKDLYRATFTKRVPNKRVQHRHCSPHLYIQEKRSRIHRQILYQRIDSSKESNKPWFRYEKMNPKQQKSVCFPISKVSHLCASVSCRSNLTYIIDKCKSNCFSNFPSSTRSSTHGKASAHQRKLRWDLLSKWASKCFS